MATKPPPVISKCRAGAPGPNHALLQAGEDHVFHVTAGAEPVQADAVGEFAGQAQGMLADRGEGDRHHFLARRGRHEIGRHQGEGVVLAAEVEFLARLPVGPDRTQGLDVFAQARGRRGPGHAEAAFVVRPDLRADAQHEAAAGGVLQVPAGVGDDHRAAREGDGDRGAQLDPIGVHRGDGMGKERVVLVLHRQQPVIAGLFGGDGGSGGGPQVGLRQGVQDPHRISVLPFNDPGRRACAFP